MLPDTDNRKIHIMKLQELIVRLQKELAKRPNADVRFRAVEYTVDGAWQGTDIGFAEARPYDGGAVAMVFTEPNRVSNFLESKADA